MVEVETTRGVLPPQVEAESVNGLAITQPVQALQHHHDRYDSWRYRPTTDLAKQILEVFIGEEPVTLAVQQRVDRRRRQALSAESGGRSKNSSLGWRMAK